MNVAKTSLKSGILATAIFNILIISENGFSNKTIIIAFISFILLLFISFFGIITTTFPIFFIDNYDKNNKENFKKYFPYFSMLFFIVSAWFIYIMEFEKFAYLISLTAFFTAMSAWVWLFSDSKIN